MFNFRCVTSRNDRPLFSAFVPYTHSSAPPYGSVAFVNSIPSPYSMLNPCGPPVVNDTAFSRVSPPYTVNNSSRPAPLLKLPD